MIGHGTSTPRAPRPPARRRARAAAGLLTAALVGTLGAAGVGAARPAAAAVDISVFCAAAPAPSRFPDAGFFTAEIACIDAAGITRGVTPTRYAPERTVTRAEMASFVVRLVDTAVGLSAAELNPLPERGTTGFRDVPSGSVHAVAVGRLAEAGIVQGGAGGGGADRFAPDLPVSRAQVATMLAGAYAWLTGEEIGPDAGSFPDVKGLDPRVQADINVLAGAGVTSGVGGGRYAPADPVRRGQMAAFLTRVLAVLEARGLVAPLGALPDR